MLSPNIGFSIQLDDNQSNATAQENSTILEINNNEQELKKQVFSLLMLRKFSPKDAFAVVGSDVNNGLGDFISNQVSYYVSQLNENLDVDVDVASSDQSSAGTGNRNTVQLNLSYTFLDGRLKVSGGGGFNNAQNSVNTEANNAFIGDWAVKYLLTTDGKLLLRAFSQADQLIGVPRRETGVSIQVAKSFDDLRELVPGVHKETSKPEEITNVKNDIIFVIP